MHPPLPPSIKVLPNTDVEGEWQRFAPFEALHHLHTICNPMDSTALDWVLDRLSPAAGERMLDVACGHGELALRAAARTNVDVVGVDLSPWVLARAAERAKHRSLQGSVAWWLGDGATIAAAPEWDVITCLGASWIWHGFAGTIRALSTRLRPGGRIAVGDLRAKRGIAPEVMAAAIGPDTALISESDQEAIIRSAGLVPLDVYVSPDEAWAGYHHLVTESAETYQGPKMAVDYQSIAREWQEEFEHDRHILEWTVWIAEEPGRPVSP